MYKFYFASCMNIIFNELCQLGSCWRFD